MTSTSRCEYCGNELEAKNFALPGHRPRLVTMPCECEGAKAEREREDAERERRERIDAFATAWTRVGIPEMFLHVDANSKWAAPLLSGRSVYLVGDNGRGKTHEACRIAKAYLGRNTYRNCGIMRCWKTALFVTMQDMLSQLRTSWDRWDQTEEDVFQRWAGVDLLILDDLGKGVPSEWAAENAFRLVNSRWSNLKPMVITSQYSIAELSDRYAKAGDETMAALVSRLGGWCDVRRFEGVDRRNS